MNEKNYSFERVEKKYLLHAQQYDEFARRIAPYVEEDTYGRYTICNIYFDTDSYELIRESIDKPLYKEKMRMRSYGTPTAYDTVYLELKKKYDRTVYKRRLSCTLKEAEQFLEKGTPIIGNDQVLHELQYFIKFHAPCLKLYLAYDRIAFRGTYDQDLRITFDTNLRSRTYDLTLDAGDYGTNYFREKHVLLEIKVAQSLPLWLVAILSQMQIYPVSFSKYGSIYKKDIAVKPAGGYAHV